MVFIDKELTVSSGIFSILIFSKKLRTELQNYINRGYKLSGAKAIYIVYWMLEVEDLETKVILPVVGLERI